MAKMSKRTERFRPEAAPGETVDGLSLPQQEAKREPAAVQKHHTVPVMRQVARLACQSNQRRCRGNAVRLSQQCGIRRLFRGGPGTHHIFSKRQAVFFVDEWSWEYSAPLEDLQLLLCDKMKTQREIERPVLSRRRGAYR